MSNLPSPPASRPLEQLKVAELRDELKKRGLSPKGVKKELLERLEESISQEQQGGLPPREHQEDASKPDATDEPEDFEGEEETLDGGKEETSKVQNASENEDIANASLSNGSPTPSVFTSEQATPSQEVQALSAVSAPEGVLRASEDREQGSTAGDLKSNNNVLFVDNAACENGDANLSSENVPDNETSIVESSEPGKGAVAAVFGIGHVENNERMPNSVVPEVAASKNVDVIYESSGGNETAVLAMMPLENVEPNAETGNIVNMMSDNMMVSIVTEDQQSRIESTETILSETAVQMPVQAVTSLSSDTPTAQNVARPSEVSESDDAGKQKKDNRGIFISEEKPDAQLACAEEHEDIDVKVAPMNMETGSDRNFSGVGQEQKVFEEDVQQGKGPADAPQELDLSNDFNARKIKDGESTDSFPLDLGKDARTDVDMKHAKDISEADVQVKRGGEFKQQEPAKRMRRWNSGNQVAVDTLKPLTSDTVKEIMLPETTNGSSVVSQRVTSKVAATSRSLPGSMEGYSVVSQSVTPKIVATSRSLPPMVKVECELPNNTRTVPPSKRTPSNSLKIERFVRPFTLKAVKDLLAKFGQCTDFWMDQIKTHCFVSYSSVNEAVAARNGLYGRQWPPSVGNFLTADFVDPNEVKIRSEGLSEKAQAVPAAAMSQAPDSISASVRVDHSQSSFRTDSTSFHTDSTTSLLPRFSRGQQFSPLPPEPAVPTLEDLFFKTKAKPHIYYLPLTDEQVAEKLKNKQAVK